MKIFMDVHSRLDTVPDFVSEVNQIDSLFICGKKGWTIKASKFYEKYEKLYGQRLLLKLLFCLYFQKPKFGKRASRPIFFARYAKRHWSITESILDRYDSPPETIHTFLPAHRITKYSVKRLFPNSKDCTTLIDDVYRFIPEKYFIYRNLNKDCFTKKVK